MRNWVQLAAAGVSARKAAAEMKCSVGTAAKRLAQANRALLRPVDDRLADGAFEASCAAAQLRILKLRVLTSEQQRNLPESEKRRLHTIRVGCSRETAAQRALSTRVPFTIPE